MCNELDKTLYRVAEDIFVSLAFMLPMPPEEVSEQGGESGSPTSAVSVTFTGALDGTLVLAVGDGMLPQLAANMLGLDESGPEASRDQQLDALKELANVICGNLLTEAWSPETSFSVSSPHFLGQDVSVEAFSDSPPVATARLELMDGPARVALFTEQDPADTGAAVMTAARGEGDGKE